MKALILVDLQNDFMPWGSVGAPDADEIIPIANRLMEFFDLVVASQDWHPINHISFAANHPWRMPGRVIELGGVSQLLWTMHCVEHSFGAELATGLNTGKIPKVIKKGTNPNVDCYGVFFENDGKSSTGLEDFLKKESVDEVFVLGPAADFGVKFTALDAIRLGFKTTVILDGCRWLDSDVKNIEKTLEELKSKGVQIIHSDELKA